MTQQVQISHCIEDLVFDEFVLVAQSIFIQNSVIIDNNGVIQTAAQCQIALAQALNVLEQAKRASATDFFDE